MGRGGIGFDSIETLCDILLILAFYPGELNVFVYLMMVNRLYMYKMYFYRG